MAQRGLQQIDVGIPAFNKGQSKASTLSNSVTEASSKIAKQGILHQGSYYYLNKVDSVINLVTNDFRLVCLPEHLLPLYVKPGVKITVTIEQADDTQMQREAEEILHMQAQFRNGKPKFGS